MDAAFFLLILSLYKTSLLIGVGENEYPFITIKYTFIQYWYFAVNNKPLPWMDGLAKGFASKADNKSFYLV